MNAGMPLPKVAISSTTASGNLAAVPNGNVAGFGSVLTALSTANLPTEGKTPVLQADQATLLQELVQFLQIGNLSELDGGHELGRDIMLEGMQIQTHPIVAALLNGNLIDEKLLNKLVDSLKESGQSKDTDIEKIEEMPFLSMGAIDLLSIIKALAGMNEEQLAQIDLNSASNVLKFAKIHELLSAYQDMSSEKEAIGKEIKNLLQQVAAKVQQLLDGGTESKSGGTASTKLTGSDNGQNIALLKGVYQRMAKEVHQANSSAPNNKVNEASNVKQLELHQSQPQHFQISKLEQFVLTVEKSGQPVNQEQFIKAFENILSKSNFTNGNGMQKLLIKLNPEHLGSLRIELIQKDAVLTARIMATSTKAKELLESQLQGLKHAFNGQNLQVDKIEVSQTLNSFTQERFLQRDSDGSQQHERRKQQEQENGQEQSETGFTADLEDALLNAKV
ncbi:flagellar hook-length control protein FliK [Peribacillus glennii]|uniref:Flagellar hook-length control protein-like C-terminal domain-containing protein n=1 Tax=Peribacillus glennii TaxID=2303991 RepID=A0A372L860_9BACI|nr:flagellar hook-length control protein FliK [Peribacillus glennii]RFU61529.1 hypothetical protein D0466_17150 [Peribacillus glennii]